MASDRTGSFKKWVKKKKGGGGGWWSEILKVIRGGLCLVYPAGAARNPDGHLLYPNLPTPSLPVPAGMMSRASWGCCVPLLCLPLSQLGFSPTVTRDHQPSTYQQAAQRACETLQTQTSYHR